MDDPRRLLARTTNIFQLICFILATYMTIRLVDRFLANRDATSITYKGYSNTLQDKYPTYSLCFQGTPFHWNKDLEIFSAYELTAFDYQRMLVGQTPIRYQYDVISRLYSKIPTSMANESFVNHTNFHVQFSEILVSAKFTYENSNHSIHFRNQAEKTSKDPLPFKVGYHTPEMICFTRDSNESIGSIRLNDHMFLNIPVLNHTLYEETEMEIFVHYPGQLIRSLNNPILSLSFGEYQLGKMLEIKLSQGTVLRKRADSNEKCNDKIELHDEVLMKEISKKFKCVPPYWTGVVVKDLILSQCTSPSILREVYTYIKDTKRMVTLHDPPCLDMYNAVTYNLRPRATEQIPMINFDYKEKYYEEIQYVKDFDIESFWSGIGGFVGIFLGYSMMQFPELIGKLSI